MVLAGLSWHFTRDTCIQHTDHDDRAEVTGERLGTLKHDRVGGLGADGKGHLAAAEWACG